MVAENFGIENQSARAEEGALGVVHIPKTGGSAIRAVLAGNSDVCLGPTYFDDAMIGAIDVEHLPDWARRQFVNSEDLRELCRTHRVVIGHYGAQALLDAGCDRLAVIVREPRSRLLSLYRFWQSQTDEVRRAWGEWGESVLNVAATTSLEEFLASRRAWAATENAMARQLLVEGTPESPRQARRLARRELRSGSGYERLRDSLVVAEWSHDTQRFADRVNAVALQGEERSVGRVNETVVVGAAQHISGRCAELLSKHTDLDTQVVERLVSDGLLAVRSTADLEAEFRESANNLGFTVKD